MHADHYKVRGNNLWFRLSPEGEIAEISGDTDRVLCRSVMDLWRQPLADVFEADAARAVSDAIAALREGRPSGVTVALSGARGKTWFRLEVRLAGRNVADGFAVAMNEVAAPDAWTEIERDEGVADRFDDGGAFLDRAAELMAAGNGEHAMTMVGVTGGLAAFQSSAEQQSFRRIVDSTARDMGAIGTADLDDGAWGVLHRRDYDSAGMVRSIGEQAVMKGVIADAGQLVSARVDPDGTDLNGRQARSTFGHVLSGLRKGISGTFGLGRVHDEASIAAKRQIDAIARVLRDGTMFRQFRPVVSLLRQRVAIHQIKADPVVNGTVMPLDQVFGLVDADDLHVDCELAGIELAILHHIEYRTWRSISMRVMASIRRTFLMREDVRKRLARMAKQHGIGRHSLILRPYDPLSGALTGSGGSLMGLIDDAPWSLSLPDFYAFVSGDAQRRQAVDPSSTVSAYIEVGVDRLETLSRQSDGTFLVRSLVENWRARQIEVLASAVNTRADRAVVEKLGIRYARGRLVGDWSQDVEDMGVPG
ncbi:MAG: hypothetical protein VYB54_08885 [Pseudomonadota bacterium]|nr:hypothetical protein [Pseudomonadota bacterium]